MSLSLRQVQTQRQELKLSAQLLQSLRILQLPQQRLEAFLEEQAQLNPFLEVELGQVDPNALRKATSVNAPPQNPGGTPPPPTYEAGGMRKGPASRGGDDELPTLEQTAAATESFRTHLLEQMPDLLFADDREKTLVLALIDSLEPDGYLRTPLVELAENFGVDEEEIEDALIALQDQFEPAGIGARSLLECYEIQARRHFEGNDLLLKVIREHLDDVEAERFDAIERALGIAAEDVAELARLIAGFDRSPGLLFGDPLDFVQPDFRVERGPDGRWQAVPLRQGALQVRVRDDADALLQQAGDSKEKAKLREQLQWARSTENAIQRRFTTEYQVVNAIVAVQQRFFDEGPIGLKALTQREIAEEVDVHESTVSRVVAGRYIELPDNSTHELREFFPRALDAVGGGAASSAAAKQLIFDLIAAEDATSPYSDSAIADVLKDQHGIDIARRTVAKYRNAMNIPARSKRRKNA